VKIVTFLFAYMIYSPYLCIEDDERNSKSKRNLKHIIMDKNSLVILRGSKELKIDEEVFTPLTFYRSIAVTENATIVNGFCIPNQEIERDFELAYDKVIRDWELIGLVVGGKPITKKKFKELADVHVYGRQTNNNRIAFFNTHPKECLYGFYPMYNENKAKQLDSLYVLYLETVNGNMSYIDQEYIQFGNCGIPLSYSDLRKRY
jgi:hypothetical protein